MIWLTWRLQRLELGLVAGILAILTVYLVGTGVGIASVYHDLGSACAVTTESEACSQAITAIAQQAEPVVGVFNWLGLLPLAFAVLIAAPMLLQLEHGTYRLVWTQSATKDRWLVIMLGFALLMTLLASGMFDLLTSWWWQPLDAIEGRLHSGFDYQGIVPVAYSVFALALAISAGVFLRRTIAAVGVAFAGFVAVRFAITTWLRPHYLPPARFTWPLGHYPKHAPNMNLDWQLAMGFSNHRGTLVPTNVVLETCPNNGNGISMTASPCLLHHDWAYNTILYQPASRFWPFQFVETVIYLGLAAVLLGVAIWWIRRRLV